MALVSNVLARCLAAACLGLFILGLMGAGSALQAAEAMVDDTESSSSLSFVFDRKVDKPSSGLVDGIEAATPLIPDLALLAASYLGPANSLVFSADGAPSRCRFGMMRLSSCRRLLERLSNAELAAVLSRQAVHYAAKEPHRAGKLAEVQRYLTLSEAMLALMQVTVSWNMYAGLDGVQDERMPLYWKAYEHRRSNDLWRACELRAPKMEWFAYFPQEVQVAAQAGMRAYLAEKGLNGPLPADGLDELGRGVYEAGERAVLLYLNLTFKKVWDRLVGEARKHTQARHQSERLPYMPKWTAGLRTNEAFAPYRQAIDQAGVELKERTKAPKRKLKDGEDEGGGKRIHAAD